MKITIKKENQKEIYEIPNWLADQKQFVTMQNTNMEEIEVNFVQETEKAICVIADELIGNVWVPKSQLKEFRYSNPSIVKSILEYHGEDVPDEIILQKISNENVKKYGKENIIKSIREDMKK